MIPPLSYFISTIIRNYQPVVVPDIVVYAL